MNLIDTHAHLYVDVFDSDLDQVIKSAKSFHINRVLLPNIDNHSIPALIRIWKEYPDFFIPMMGLHPCSVEDNYKEVLAIIEQTLSKYAFSCIGEIGLDYYWDTTKMKEQQEAFRMQIAWAKEKQIPIAVHCREAFNDVLQILEEEQNGNLKGVLHCFTGNLEQAQRLIDLGFYLGVGGVITYKNGGLDKTLLNIDMKHLVLETDAPYLSPVPFRGKRNESAYLIYIAEKLAEVKGLSLSEVGRITTENAEKLFGLTNK